MTKTTANERRLFEAVVRNNFEAFARLVCNHAHAANPIRWSWYHSAICHHLQMAFDGKIRRLIINVPPRHLKSWLASVAFPAFVLGRHPSAKVICMSYSAEVGGLFARQCRDTMRSEFYRALFPDTVIRRDRHAAHDFFTTGRGHRSMIPLTGSLTGRGGDFLIIDDPMKVDEVMSDTRRSSALQTFDGTVYSRFDNNQAGAMIIVMQRLHVEDLVGHILEKGGDWTVLSIPAIAETKTSVPTGPNRFYHRQDGELLDPARFPREDLDRLKVDLGSAAFAAQYQQSPVPASGNIFRAEWLHTYDEASLPHQSDGIIQSWDIGMKDNAEADYSVGTTWWICGDRYFLINLHRVKLGFPDLKRKIAREYRAQPGSTLLIEDTGSGTGLIQMLSEEGIHAIGIKPTKDKISRANIVTPLFEAGRVLLPRFERFFHDLKNEMLAFPKGRNDDQVDSIVQAINWHQDHLRYPGTAIFGYY